MLDSDAQTPRVLIPCNSGPSCRGHAKALGPCGTGLLGLNAGGLLGKTELSPQRRAAVDIASPVEVGQDLRSDHSFSPGAAIVYLGASLKMAGASKAFTANIGSEG